VRNKGHTLDGYGPMDWSETRNTELRLHPVPLPGATTPEIVAVAVGMAEVAAIGHAKAERTVVK
jgi:hypothetical protein